MKLKTSAIILGIFMGCAGVFGGMAWKNHTTEAAVAVWDQKNIAEAIKTVLNTTNILTEEQKKIALELLNMKSLDANKLWNIMQGHKNRQDEFWNEKGAYEGVLAAKKSVPGAWDEAFGQIDLILDGDISPQDVGQLTATGIRMIEKTNRDAAAAAKAQQQRDEELQKAVEQKLIDNQNPEGEMQVQQIGNALQADHINATLDGNNLLKHLTTLKATEMQDRIAQRAKWENQAATAQSGMNSFVSSILGN